MLNQKLISGNTNIRPSSMIDLTEENIPINKKPEILKIKNNEEEKLTKNNLPYLNQNLNNIINSNLINIHKQNYYYNYNNDIYKYLKFDRYFPFNTNQQNFYCVFYNNEINNNLNSYSKIITQKKTYTTNQFIKNNKKDKTKKNKNNFVLFQIKNSSEKFNNNHISKLNNFCYICQEKLNPSDEIKYKNNKIEISENFIIDKEKNISCLLCKKYFHLFCLKNLERKPKALKNINQTEIIEEKAFPDILSFLLNEKFYCPACFITIKVFPYMIFSQENFIFASFKNRFTFTITNKDLLTLKNTNISKRVGLMAIDIEKLYLPKNKNIEILNFEYLFKLGHINFGNINSNFNNYEISEKEFLTFNIYKDETLYLKKEILMGKLIDITDELSQVGVSNFNFDFSFFKNKENDNNFYNDSRRVIFFISEYEKKDLKRFILEIKMNILNFEASDNNKKILRNAEIENILKQEKKASRIKITKSIENIKFTCPYTFKLMNIPIKGIKCLHYNCFDLESFLSIYYRNQKNKCPICNKFIIIDNLTYGFVIDDLVKQKRLEGYTDSELTKFQKKINLKDYYINPNKGLKKFKLSNSTNKCKNFFNRKAIKIDFINENENLTSNFHCDEIIENDLVYSQSNNLILDLNENSYANDRETNYDRSLDDNFIDINYIIEKSYGEETCLELDVERYTNFDINTVDNEIKEDSIFDINYINYNNKEKEDNLEPDEKNNFSIFDDIIYKKNSQKMVYEPESILNIEKNEHLNYLKIKEELITNNDEIKEKVFNQANNVENNIGKVL